MPEASFPIRQILLDENEATPGRARNAAARRANGGILVFLDDDCIPHPSLLDDYAAAAAGRNGALMGEVDYLPKGAEDEGIDYARFDELAVAPDDRPQPPTSARAVGVDFGSFAALNFAMRAGDFARVRGFDERYAQEAGAACDFARALAGRHLPLWQLRGAKAYHQHHSEHMPPVHAIDEILADVRRYAGKWNEPVLEEWLRALTLMGLVKRQGDEWIKLREPNESDLALTRQQDNQPYASATPILRWLEGRSVRRLGAGPDELTDSSTAAA